MTLKNVRTKFIRHKFSFASLSHIRFCLQTDKRSSLFMKWFRLQSKTAIHTIFFYQWHVKTLSNALKFTIYLQIKIAMDIKQRNFVVTILFLHARIDKAISDWDFNGFMKFIGFAFASIASFVIKITICDCSKEMHKLQIDRNWFGIFFQMVFLLFFLLCFAFWLAC